MTAEKFLNKLPKFVIRQGEVVDIRGPIRDTLQVRPALELLEVRLFTISEPSQEARPSPAAIGTVLGPLPWLLLKFPLLHFPSCFSSQASIPEKCKPQLLGAALPSVPPAPKPSPAAACFLATHCPNCSRPATCTSPGSCPCAGT